jgi:hypothetical protein
MEVRSSGFFLQVGAYFGLGVAVALAGLASLLLYAHRITVELAVVIPILVAVGFLLLFGMMFFLVVRSVDVSRDGVLFRIGFRAYMVPWGRVGLPTKPYQDGMVFRDVQPATPGTGDTFVLDRSAARAILEHPSCPKQDIPPSILSSVGIH